MSFPQELPTKQIDDSGEDDSESYQEDETQERLDVSEECSIPRTSGVEHTIEADASDGSEELDHETYPPSQFINANEEVLKDFQNRSLIDTGSLSFSPMKNFETSNIPEYIASNVDKCTVHLLDVSKISGGSEAKKYIHSWCDLTAVSGAEATRAIRNFFETRYRSISSSTFVTKPEMTWVKAECPRIFPPIQTQAPRGAALSIRIFHYIGLGFPAPEATRLWTKDPGYSSDGWTKLADLKQMLSGSCMAIFDCDRAGILSEFLEENMGPSFSALLACTQNEYLHIPSELPRNFFTCVLLSPEVVYSSITHVEVKDAAVFNRLLDLFTESIALDVLPTELFYRLFRENTTVATLWRRFLLAERMMKRFGIHTQSIPRLPDMGEHPLWKQFDISAMQCGKDDVIESLTTMYLTHLKKVRKPPKYVLAVIGLLMQEPSQRNRIVIEISKFMEKSPENCRAMSLVMSRKSLGDLKAAFASSPEFFHSWCKVVSGLFLAVPALTKRVTSATANDAMKLVVDPTCDEMCRVYLMSILVRFKDSQAHFPCYMNSRTINQLINPLLKSSPIIREWLAMLIHASISHYQHDPETIAASGLHVYAMMMLFEEDKFTRAVGAAILGSMMNRVHPEFNTTLMMCAMKAVIDASSLVRQSFLYCAAAYINLHPDVLNDNGSVELGDLTGVDFVESVNKQSKLPPMQALLMHLSMDPCEELRSAAKRLLADPTRSLGNGDFGTVIHSCAHMALFTQKTENARVPLRYSSNLFLTEDLELLEVIKPHESMISVISFDANHGNLIIGYTDGTVHWMTNKWHFDSAVVSIVHINSSTIVAATSSGHVHILVDKIPTSVESFKPFIDSSASPIRITAIPGIPKIAISQGTDLLIWNLSSLLLESHMHLSAVLSQVIAFDHKLVCGLCDGSLAEIDLATLSVRVVDSTRVIIRVGEHKNRLYKVLADGVVSTFDGVTSPVQEVRHESDEFTDLMFHKHLPLGVKLTPRMAYLIPAREGTAISLDARRDSPVCCCVDDAQPLCAVGYADGSIAVWKIQCTKTIIILSL